MSQASPHKDIRPQWIAMLGARRIASDSTDQFALAKKGVLQRKNQDRFEADPWPIPVGETFEVWTLKESGMGPGAATKTTTMTPSPGCLSYVMMVDVRNSYCYRELGGTSRGNTQMRNTIMNYVKSHKD